MPDFGFIWICPKCDEPNAGFRIRCENCGKWRL